jgi:hypothetical protein
VCPDNGDDGLPMGNRVAALRRARSRVQIPVEDPFLENPVGELIVECLTCPIKRDYGV